jgi:hypothetical protein
MKTINLKFMAPLLLTFVLQGCMPDSLTKFNKEAPKKTASATTTTTPTVDETIPPSSLVAPSDLSLGTRQIITVSTTVFFTEGEALHEAIVPPLVDAAHGKILKILNGSQMAIETSNSAFLAEASLDSGSGFFSEKAFIIPDNSCTDTLYTTKTDCEANSATWSTGPIFYNIALKLSGTNSGYTAGSYVTSVDNGVAADLIDDGAKGLVAGVFTAANDILFVRHLTQTATGIATAKTFNQGDTLVGSLLTVDEIDSNFIIMNLSDASLFDSGKDVTSTNFGTTTIQAGGYTYKKLANAVYVSDITKSPSGSLFKITNRLYNSDNLDGTFTDVTDVTHDILLVTERGKKIFINTSITADSALFSIAPALPVGLSLDTKTGQISGTPTTMMARKNFRLTAANSAGSATYVFSLEVRDYFSITESSGAPSFLLHKIGSSQIDRKCRVNASDIISNSGALLDVRCHLEAEEEDLYFNPIKFEASSGPGVCQYVKYSPYYFWQYSPKQSLDTSTLYPGVTTVYSGCTAAGSIPVPDMCDGNYAAYGADGPNCDEGSLKYFTQAQTGTGTVPDPCVNSGAPVAQYVSCGGKKTSCIAGPVKDLLTDTEVQDGFRSKIYQSPNGITQSWTLSSPIAKGDFGNMRVSNSTTNNACTTSNADVNTWSTKAAGTLNTTAPFGQTSPYYIVSCLNAASQIKARIRVIVRDWDKNFKINNGVELDNPVGTYMNSSTSDIYSYPYNNHDDWDNDYTNLGSCDLGGGYSEYSCVANNGIWNVSGADYLGGTCDNGAHTTQATCVSPEVWTPNPYVAGVCTGFPAFTNKSTCEAAGHAWTGTCGVIAPTGRNYAYPGSNL